VLKIAVYAISKNEEQFVERFLESAKEADLIMIGDTGSTDDTIKKTVEMMNRGFKISCFKMSVSPWRFDIARNTVLALIPDDMDVCVSLDMDEVLQPGWREEIEKAWVPGTTRLQYLFNWGGPAEFIYDKIHARKGYRWVNPCHEFPTPYGIEEKYARLEKLLVVHLPDPTKSRGQYLPMLEMSVQEDPHDPRNGFYYARELSFVSDWSGSIKECDRYLALPKATWAGERAYAHRTKGRCYVELHDLANAEKSYHAAAAETPTSREPWCELAHIMYLQARWPECYAYAMRTLSITNKEKVYTVDHDVWGFKPYLYACLGAWNIGLRDEALALGHAALAEEPANELLRKNVEVMRTIMGKS
jgi:hypothetical protein